MKDATAQKVRELGLHKIYPEHFDKQGKAIERQTKKLNAEQVFKTGRFEANGKVYVIHSSVPVCNRQRFEKAQLRFAYDLSFEGLYDKMKAIYGYLNSRKLIDIAQAKADDIANVLGTISNVMQAIDTFDERIDAAMEICALHIYEVGEEGRELTDSDIKTKIEDWGQMEYAFFLSLASVLVPNFKKRLQENSLTLKKVISLLDENQLELAM